MNQHSWPKLRCRRPLEPVILWTLVQLRYRLLWAQARSSRGRIAILLSSYVLGGALFLLLSLGGAGAAVAAVESGRGEELARWILACVCSAGIAAGIALGTGPRRAFAVQVLRRYPMSAHSVVLARHLTGMLDPAWILALAAASGLAVGFALLGFRTLMPGLCAGALCVSASYLSTLILFSIVDHTLHKKWGATILGAIVFALSTVAGLAGPILVAAGGAHVFPMLDGLLRCSPPGLTASILAGGNTVAGSLGLIAWCVGLAMVLAKLEKLSQGSIPVEPPGTMGEVLYGKIETLFRGFSGPLVGKALRYHLRSNRARFNLALSIPMMAVLPGFMGRNSGPDATFLMTLALFFCGGIAATSSLTFNQFGYDGAGILRYYLIPVPLGSSLRAGSIASILVGAMAILPGLSLWGILQGDGFDIRKMLMVCSIGIAGLFFFNATGIWTTVLEPRRLDFGSVVGNQLSSGGNLVMFGGVALTLGGAFVLIGSGRSDVMMSYWWLLPVNATFCFLLYAASLRYAARFMYRRRGSMASALSGAGPD
jgi:hypothetical protein